ncbi:BAP_1a_G0041990.mRNA.1.CDS.1 [Saccharomyces cerevisiae]|nr:BAP_1a_G0041990.mRNA.1.CDS.1 [Saccharomyces cerevisiae]CAI7277910.1 BAP_1a_G0041990.mRNA.1.CDS.1 [Saccharomyces cerevisiae]
MDNTTNINTNERSSNTDFSSAPNIKGLNSHTQLQFDADSRVFVSDAMAKNSKQLLYAHIYNYLIKNNYWNSAAKFLSEADLPLSRINGSASGEKTSLNASLKQGLMDIASKGDIVSEDGLLPSKMLMDANDTFLLEWWEIFQSLFNGDLESGYQQDHNPLRERIIPILPANSKSNMPSHFSNLPPNVIPPTQNSFPVSEESFRPNGDGSNFNLNDPTNRNVSERFLSRTSGVYDKQNSANFAPDTAINMPPTNQQFNAQTQSSMFSDQQRFFQYQLHHQNQGQAPSFQQSQSGRFDDMNAMKMFFQQQALQQNSLQQNLGNQNYQSNTRNNTAEETTPTNDNNANGNSLLQEHIRARFNKMKTIPQQMKNQSTVANPVVSDITSQQQYMHMMMQRMAANQQLQNSAFPPDTNRIAPANNAMPLQPGNMGPPVIENPGMRQTNPSGQNPMINMQPLYQNVSSAMHAFAPQQQFHLPQHYKTNTSVPQNDSTSVFPLPNNNNNNNNSNNSNNNNNNNNNNSNNTPTVSQPSSKRTSSSSTTPNITTTIQPKRKQRVGKTKTKESRKVAAAQKVMKSKKLEQNGDSAATNFINVTPKDSGGKGTVKVQNSNSQQQLNGSFSMDTETFDIFNIGDFSPDLMDS